MDNNEYIDIKWARSKLNEKEQIDEGMWQNIQKLEPEDPMAKAAREIIQDIGHINARRLAMQEIEEWKWHNGRNAMFNIGKQGKKAIEFWQGVKLFIEYSYVYVYPNEPCPWKQNLTFPVVNL